MADQDQYVYNVRTEYREENFTEWFQENEMKNQQFAKTFQFRDDDIVVCTLPRSGTHMIWIIIRYLLQGSTNPLPDAEEDSHFPFHGFIDSQKGRRAIHCHCIPADLGNDVMLDGNRKFIYVVRNPKDQLVSFYCLMQIFNKIFSFPETWPEYVRRAVTHTLPGYDWPHHARAWEEYLEHHPNSPVLSLVFEEVVRDWRTHIQKIADFLAIPLGEQLLNDIVESTKIENMKKAAPQSEWIKGQLRTERGSFYRKGAIGGWKHWFTVGQNETFDAAIKSRMEGSKVTAIYE